MRNGRLAEDRVGTLLAVDGHATVEQEVINRFVEPKIRGLKLIMDQSTVLALQKD